MDGDLIARYRAGASMRALAEHFNVSCHKIRQGLVAADEPLKPRGRQRLAMSSDSIAELYDAGLDFDEIAARLGVHPQSVRSRYNEIRSQRGLVRRGRWHRLLLDALEQHPRVVVIAAAAEHLGREPTTNEAYAARRAARDLALAGDATLDYESVPGRRSSFLVIAKNRDRKPRNPAAEAATPTAAGSSRVGHNPWYEIFDDALAIHAIVAVDRVAEAHLGRAPSPSEIRSSHRAANGYARGGSKVQILQIWSRHGDGLRSRALFLARIDADLDNTDQLLAAYSGHAPASRTQGRSRGTPSTQQLSASIVKDAHAARQVADINDLDPAQAQQLAEEITAALNDFRRLRDRLYQLGQHTD